MITIVNYGLSNILSVRRAVEICGTEAQVTDDYHEVLNAKKIILPGVGAFQNGMDGLRKLELDKALKEAVYKGIPVMGICLGMQMLMDESEENGKCEGLGFIEGCVKKIESVSITGQFLRVPHIGWNALRICDMISSKTVVNKDFDQREVYFVHSYEVIAQNKENVIATVKYGEHDICAIVAKDNVIGCQFHPEKSGETGLKIIDNFIRL